MSATRGPSRLYGRRNLGRTIEGATHLHPLSCPGALRAVTTGIPLVAGRWGMAIPTHHDTIDLLEAQADHQAALPHRGRSPTG